LRLLLPVAAALVLNPGSTARAASVEVRVVRSVSGAGGAVGLLVPAAGRTVSRSGALRTLRDYLGCRARPPCRVRILLTLPPPGTHHNVRRYRIAVVGPGYRGLLVSDRTRIPGLVGLDDVGPTVEALEAGRTPPITSRGEADVADELDRLDRRLSEAHDARGRANLVVALALVAGALLALRSRRLAGAAVLVAPAALAAALLLSALGSTSVWAFAALAVAAPLLLSRLPVGLVVSAFLAGYLVALWVWPDVNALAILGPHPDGGGRFYGVTNQVETLLLPPALAAGVALGLPWLAAPAALGLVAVGASVAGDDGGGMVVFAVAFLVLAIRVRGLELSPRRLVTVAAAAVAITFAVVGIDAAFGGSGHVTRAVGGGPGSLSGDFAHRMHVSADGIVASRGAEIAFAAGAIGLAWLALRRPRSPGLDALLVGLLVSLLVNDTPTDVVGYGALGGLALWAWERSHRVRA
jgi:hypothetical protein